MAAFHLKIDGIPIALIKFCFEINNPKIVRFLPVIAYLLTSVENIFQFGL
jgi:hypothetical protein